MNTLHTLNTIHYIHSPTTLTLILIITTNLTYQKCLTKQLKLT